MAPKQPRGFVNVLLFASIACSAATLVLLLMRPPVTRWTGTLSTVSLLCVIGATAFLRRGSRAGGQ